MLKKIIFSGLTLSAIAATSIAVASPAPYLGASVGIANNTSSNAIGNLPGYARGVPFEVFAGYGGVISESLYLGGEITGTVATAEISSSGGVKTTYGYGASIMPGIMLSDHTLAFVRAGVVRSQFSSVDDKATGGQFGVGIQTLLTQNIDLRLEYAFTAYQSVGKVTNVGGNVIDGKLDAPRSDAFNIGLVYKFN
ncbi:MAG TPA: outer membrane beta-barrel protein [Gammaproteobacteria bacterium]|jgi:opacity protein-like surface antigen|nr:outer membrane beta-barrel protein [Gammaproteobacteria bacterium]